MVLMSRRRSFSPNSQVEQVVNMLDIKFGNDIGTRMRKHGHKILTDKRRSDSDLPKQLERLVKLFVLYIVNHAYKSPIKDAIHSGIVTDQQIIDTLTVLSNGADKYDESTDIGDIISSLIRENKLPAQTGGQSQNVEKLKIQKRKYRKTRSIKNRRITRRRRSRQ